MQLLISSVCMALTSAVVGNAYYQKKQFYPAVVYITKSNASMAVIYIQFFVIVFMFGKLLRKIFLGTLRAAEFEHLIERFWYALTETCLAFTVFRDDFNPRFVALFTVLLFLKSFHWLAEERVDFMERSPVLGWLFHLRVASLLSMLGVLDYVLLVHAYNSTLVRGPSVQLVFGFEYAILLTVIASTAIKYVLHAAEMRTDTPWENKQVFLLYTELVIGFIKVLLYLLFVVIMSKVYALPMFVFRPMFFTIRNFKKALNDVIMSRRAIRNMNTLYPDATPEELRQSDNICIICREDMINHSKKLPCGHIFHTTCLRSWFQRQQTCPTCRLNILRTPNSPNSTALPRPGGEEAPPAAGVQGVAAVNTPVPATGAQPQADANAPRLDSATGAASLPPLSYDLFNDANTLPNFAAAAATATANFPTMPMMPPLMPPFPFFPPFSVPPPPMPSDLTNFSDEELNALEGTLRKNVEERIKLLRNITLMLDSVSILMNNYQAIASRIPTAPTAVATDTVNTMPSPGANTLVNNTETSYDDKPSTSAAARADEAHQVQLKSMPTTTVESAHVISAKSDKVTIEDLGVDEDDELMASISKPTAGDDEEDNTELNELRKRRLKFLEERNKSTTPTE